MIGKNRLSSAKTSGTKKLGTKHKRQQADAKTQTRGHSSSFVLFGCCFCASCVASPIFSPAYNSESPQRLRFRRLSETEHLIAADLIHPKLAVKSISFAHDRVKAPALGITAAQLDRHMSRGASVWWMPTTKEFGPKVSVFF